MTLTPELLFAGTVAGVALAVALLARAVAAGVGRAPGPPADETDGGPVTVRLPSDRPPGLAARLDAAFEQAVGRTGLDISPAGTVAFIAFCGAVAAGVAHVWKDNLLLTALAAVAGMAVPLGAVAILQGRYRRAVQEQLPDVLYTLARSLRSGLTLEQAVEAYAEQGNPPLSAELARAAARTRLGLPPAVALAGVADRVRLLDFNVFVSTVALYRQTGGNLALLLDRLAASVRERNQFRGRFRAATAQGRVVAVILGLFGPALLLGYAVWQPEYVRGFFASPTGLLILAGCFALELVGAVWTWNILQVDY